jgi:hypothetical protein
MAFAFLSLFLMKGNLYLKICHPEYQAYTGRAKDTKTRERKLKRRKMALHF